MSILTRIRIAARNRRAYNRTIAELQNLPGEALRDLRISRSDIPRVAHDAVYGG